jgi:hypothetical protein
MNWQKILGGVGSVIVIAGIYFGFSFMGKANTAKEVKDKLMGICAEDKDCVAAVNTHFDDCFDTNYALGGRRRSGGLNGEKFTSCLNQKAGKDYFSYDTKE